MYCLDFDQSFLSVLALLRDLLNSQFVSASLSALAGAGLGVWGAKRVADRASDKKELLEGLRQANALTVLASTICNQALSLKKQHVNDMTAKYFSDQGRAQEHHKAILSGASPVAPFPYTAVMLHATPMTVPIEALKSIAFSASYIPGKALATVSQLEQSIAELNRTIVNRSEMIEEFRESGPPDLLFTARYFGLPQKDGSVDMVFHDLMFSLRQYTDDVVFFASEFAEEAQTHAERLRVRVAKIQKNPPKATTVDFSSARSSGMIPARENYADWLSGFKASD